MDDKTRVRAEKLGLNPSDFEKRPKVQAEQNTDVADIIDVILGVFEDEQ